MYFVLSFLLEIALFLEKFTPLVKILHCRRQWRHWQISSLCADSHSDLDLRLQTHLIWKVWTSLITRYPLACFLSESHQRKLRQRFWVDMLFSESSRSWKAKSLIARSSSYNLSTRALWYNMFGVRWITIRGLFFNANINIRLFTKPLFWKLIWGLVELIFDPWTDRNSYQKMRFAQIWACL